jgi:two-component system nitrate/nitrite response regulator NarL
MSVIDVALVGGGALHRDGLRRSLDSNHFAVVAEGPDLGSVLAFVERGTSPRLIIADVSRLRDKDFEDLHRVHTAVPGCRIVVLSSDLNLTDLSRVFRAGADGYLVSELSREAFSLSLLVIMSGEKVLPSALADLLASNCKDFSARRVPNSQAGLTDRERQILRCLLNGYSNKLIARILEITEGTVKVHLKALMKKISAVNRTQAALWARGQGMGEDLDPIESRHSSAIRAGSLPPLSSPLGVIGHSRSGNGTGELVIDTSRCSAGLALDVGTPTRRQRKNGHVHVVVGR